MADPKLDLQQEYIVPFTILLTISVLYTLSFPIFKTGTCLNTENTCCMTFNEMVSFLSSWQSHCYRWAHEKLYFLKRWLIGLSNTCCNELQRLLGLFWGTVTTNLKIPFMQVICWNTWYDQAIPLDAQTLYLQRIFDAALQVCQIRSMMKAICFICCAESINGRNDLIVHSMPNG